MPTCPFCSSDKVYPLLNTLRCKRCKHIWKENEEDPGLSDACEFSDMPLKIQKRIDPLEKRMEKRLNRYLNRSNGKFCFTTMSWEAGDISQEVFGRYLRHCVKSRTLTEEKDRYGRTWYLRPVTKN
jgi:hypothetical protein